MQTCLRKFRGAGNSDGYSNADSIRHGLTIGYLRSKSLIAENAEGDRMWWPSARWSAIGVVWIGCLSTAASYLRCPGQFESVVPVFRIVPFAPHLLILACTIAKWKKARFSKLALAAASIACFPSVLEWLIPLDERALGPDVDGEMRLLFCVGFPGLLVSIGLLVACLVDSSENEANGESDDE
jgi:hypothetical protein